MWCVELMQCSSFHVHKMIEIKVNSDSPNLPFTLIGEYQKSTTYLCLIFCVYNLLSLIHGKLSQLYAIIALSVIELINTKINNLKHFDRALMCLIDPRCHWGCLCRWKLFEEIQKIFCHCPHQDWPPERDPNRLTGWRRSVLHPALKQVPAILCRTLDGRIAGWPCRCGNTISRLNWTAQPSSKSRASTN